MDEYQKKSPDPALLTPVKLDWLLRRYAGALGDTATLATGRPAHRRNYEDLEKLDVVTGLLDYAGFGDAHAARLIDLYAKSSLKPFGPELVLPLLQDRRDELRTRLGPAP